MSEGKRSSEELDQLLAAVEILLKSADAALELGAKGVNTSLALVAAQGLRALLAGSREQAAEDFATVADELGARLEVARRRASESS